MMTTDNKDIRTRLMGIVEPVCEDAGYELVDLSYQREQGGWIVRVFIDRLPGSPNPDPIGFDDCENVSRELSAVFDVEDPVPTAYSLEVSSPGMERPLRSAEHFRRFVGQTAKIALNDGVDGRRNFKGTLEGFDDESNAVLIRVEDGQAFSLPLSDIRSAKLVVDWDAVLKGKAPGYKEQAGA